MSPHESDRRHIERQIAYARPIVVLLALIALFEQTSSNYARGPIYFLIVYFSLSVLALLGLVGATLAAGGGSAFLGDLSRSFAEQNELLARISSTMQVDQGLSESLRLLLDELTQAFHTDGAMLVYRDADLERIFVWQLKSGEGERLIPENLPLTRADGFLLDEMDATVCWNSLAGAGGGFGWDRRDGSPLKTGAPLPAATQQVLALRSFMSVAFEQLGQPAGGALLVHGGGQSRAQ